jgi:FkbM family methyltransferase
MKIDWRRHRSFVYGTWEPHVVSAISGVVSEGDTVIDIGAHIGFYTLLLSKLAGREGKVIAFEPLPGNFSILEENIRLNGLCSRIRAVNKAVFDRSIDGMELVVPVDESSSLTSSPWASLLFKKGGERVTVKTVSLDDFLSESDSQVRFIKMDAEGAEESIIRGALRTIERYRPAMLIELHHPDSHVEDHPAIPLLHGLNYKIEWLDRFQLTSHILAVRNI